MTQSLRRLRSTGRRGTRVAGWGVALGALLLCMMPAPAPAAGGPELWVAPLDAEANGAHKGLTDFDAIFEGNWAQDPVRSSIRVFKFYPTYLGAIPDPKLEAALRSLKQHNVKVAFEASMLVPQQICGKPYAGDSGQQTIPVLERVKRLGGTVDYLAMNEPLFHMYRDRQIVCSGTVAEAAAANMASTIAGAKRIFPGIRIGDTEPVAGDAKMAEFQAQFPGWIVAYQSHYGAPLAFFHMDVAWPRAPWVAAVAQTGTMMRQHAIPFGIIFNGVDTDPTPQAWVAHAIDHYRQYDGHGPVPNDVIFQTWVDAPKQFFPANNPDSFEGLIETYLKSHGS